jgi:DNA repair exonuclease SbcCD nuclease subunit
MVFDDSYYDAESSGGDEAVLAFSDWHYGMKTSNVFNSYNAEICKQRVSNTVNAAISRIQLHRCRKLHIVVLGDLVHGAIHSSARVASEELVCEQLMQASEILAQAIMKLSQYVEETLVYMTYGNHARTVQNKHDSIHRDNMERTVPWWLTQRLQMYNNITIMPESENEFLFVNACGHDICASHGDLDTVKCSPRLLATIFQKKYGKDIEYVLLGDKHHRESFNELGITATICGSLCGTDDYANDKRLYSHPEQLLLIVNPEYGVDAEYRLKCDVS